MAFSLTLLPPEVLNIVIGYLDSRDVISLYQCVPLLISEEVYYAAFQDNTRFSHYDKEMFEGRKRASLFVFGDSGGNLRYLMKVPSHYEILNRDRCRRMHTPWKVRSDGVIVKVSLRSGVSILNSDGEFFFSKMYPKNPVTRPYDLKRLPGSPKSDNFESGRFEGRRQQYQKEMDEIRPRVKDMIELEELDYYDYGYYVNHDNNDWQEYKMLQFKVEEKLPPSPHSVVEFSHRLFAQPYHRPHFISIGCCYSIWAQDDTGMTWHLDTESQSLIPTCLVNHASWELVTGKIIRWIGDSVSLSGQEDVVGVNFYENRLTREPNGFRDGYPCLEDHCCYAQVTSPTRGRTAVDLSECGSLDFLDRRGIVSGKVLELPPKLRKLLSCHGPVVQVVGNFTQIGILATDGVAGIAEISHGEEKNPHILKISARIASIALGDKHGLALTDNGEVYTFGTEHAANGCLGLGKLENAVRMKSVTHKKMNADDYWLPDLTVTEPVKMKLPGRAYAVFADNDFSGILIDDKGRPWPNRENQPTLDMFPGLRRL